MSHNKIDKCPKCGYDLDGHALGGHIAHCDGVHPDERESEIKELQEEGLSRNQIAKRIGISKRAVRRRLE